VNELMRYVQELTDSVSQEEKPDLVWSCTDISF
jgi:hypothetical protein